MAAPTVGSAGTFLNFGTDPVTSAAVPVPSGVTSGSLVLVFLYFESNTTITPPAGAGFTEVPTAPITTGDVQSLHLFWKRATGNDSGTYNFTWTGNVWRTASAIRIAGGLTSGSPFDTGAGAPQSGTSGATDSTTTPALSLTTQGAERLLIWTGGSFTEAAWTAPTAGGTWTGQTTPTDSSLFVATRTLATGSGTGSVTGSQASARKTAWLLALPPAGPSATAPTVSAGADVPSWPVNTTFTRTATESDGGSPITARSWTIQAGTGAGGAPISASATLTWTPTVTGVYTLRYTATNAVGTSAPDDMQITVVAAGTVDTAAQTRGFLTLL